MTASIDPQLAYILEHPDDDTARLIYADHLEEQGESARAEFIRLQIRIANDGIEEHQCWQCYQRLRGGQHQNGPCRCSPEWRRMNSAWWEIKISSASTLGLVDTLRCLRGFNLRFSFGPDPQWLNSAERSVPVACFHRGFIEIVQCPIRQWLDIADEVTAKHPIREVHFLPHPQGSPLPFTYDVTDNLMKISVRSHHGLSMVVRSDLTPDEVDDEIMKLFKDRWPHITFFWNTFSITG